jgi:hypothetical protein
LINIQFQGVTAMIRPSTSCQISDVITGEPNRQYMQRFSDRRDLLRPEQVSRERHMIAAADVRRIVLIAGSVAAIIFGAAGSATAEGPKSATPVRWMTPECAERDLKVLSLIEEHDKASDLPAAVLGEAGLTFLDARVTCLSGREAEALAKYDSILTAPQLAIRTTK